MVSASTAAAAAVAAVAGTAAVCACTRGDSAAPPPPAGAAAAAPVVAHEPPLGTAVVERAGVKVRTAPGRFSPIVSAPAGAKLPGYERTAPAGGRRKAAPLVVGSEVVVLAKQADKKRGHVWLSVRTADGVCGWLLESAVRLG